MPDPHDPYDLVIRGGTVATATDVFAADVAVRGERVAAIGQGLPAGASRDRRHRPPGPARRRRQPLPHRAAHRLGADERRHLRHRDRLGGGGRHHDGDPVRGPACRHQPDPGGRGLSCRRRARCGGRLRLPHDPVRPAPRGAGRGAAAAGAIGPRLAQGVHDLRPAADRGRAVPRRARRRPRPRADGLRARREPRHDRLDRQAPAGRRLHRTALPRALAPAPGRGGGDRPGHRLCRPGRPALDDLPRQHRRGCGRHPPRARRGAQGLGRDLHPVPDPHRRRPGPARARGCDVDVLAALARAVGPGGAVVGAGGRHAADRLLRPCALPHGRERQAGQGAGCELQGDRQRHAGPGAAAAGAVRRHGQPGPAGPEQVRRAHRHRPGAALRAPGQEGQHRRRCRCRPRDLGSRADRADRAGPAARRGRLHALRRAHAQGLAGDGAAPRRGDRRRWCPARRARIGPFPAARRRRGRATRSAGPHRSSIRRAISARCCAAEPAQPVRLASSRATFSSCRFAASRLGSSRSAWAKSALAGSSRSAMV